MIQTRTIHRNEKLRGKQIEDLRVAVGWDRMDGYYDRILARSYAHFSILDDTGSLIAFINVISDGIGDAFLVDLIVHPDYQSKRIGVELVTHVIEVLRADGIRAIQVVFDKHLEPFYRACGFIIMQSGIIDTWNPYDSMETRQDYNGKYLP